MTKRIVALGFALLLVLLAGCRQSAQPTATNSPGVTIQLAADPDKPAVGKVTLVVTLTNAGKPIDGATVSVKGDMNMAGMQPVLGETKDSTNGVYRIPFEWTMGGDWFVDVTVTLPDGTTAKQTFPFIVSA